MKPFVVMLGLFVVSLLLVFVAPHHRRVEGVSKPCTLGGIYADLLSDAFRDLEDVMAASSSARGAIWFILLTIAALLATAFPTLFVGLAHWWPATTGRGAIYVIGGLFAIIGAASNFLAMLVSHMTFGFGVSDSSMNITAFIWIIPAFQALFGLASVVAGSSARFAGLLSHWLG